MIKFSKYLFFFFILIFLVECKKRVDLSLRFLDEYVVKDSLQFQNFYIGGLSGIDFTNNRYYFVVDDSKNPRILLADIRISDAKIDTIIFKETIHLKDSSSLFFKENALDLESVFVDENGDINLVSEGSIKNKQLPTIFKIDKKGNYLENFKLQKNVFTLNNIKHNGAFESSTQSFNKKGFWVAMEAPLQSDGEEATFQKTISPVRISHFSNHTKKANKQYAYQLEHISKPAKGNINLNGVTAILEYKENHFFVVERIYQSGYGSYGNIVRIFDAKIDKSTTNIIAKNSLKNTQFVPLKKTLLFDFKNISNKLTDRIIDNIEGITFGPKLANGNQTLLLVADDNFQKYGRQLNQFILLEIITD